MVRLYSKKGSLTVEAAIAVPVFVCVIASIIFFVKIIYVHEVIQHAISQSASEISTYSYIYAVSGLQDINDSTEDGLAKSKQKLNEQTAALINTYDCFNQLDEKARDGLNDLKTFQPENMQKDYEEIVKSSEKLGESLKQSEKVIKEILSNPKEELKVAALAFSQDLYKGAKTDLVLKPYVMASLAKYMGSKDFEEADKKLKKLNIVSGFEGLDFSQSRLFEDKKHIEVVVRYKVKLGLPVNIAPEMSFVQRCKIRAWLEGDGGEKTAPSEDIWALEKLERGRKIQKIYGRNLPDKFPTITKFENGTAYLVQSINLNSKTYQENNKKVQYEINADINRLAKFAGGSMTVKENGKVNEYRVDAASIKEKVLIVVIPKGSRTQSFENIFKKCTENASDKGIKLLIEEL